MGLLSTLKGLQFTGLVKGWREAHRGSGTPTYDPNFSWEEDRRFILRGWSLVFSILATLMLLSVVDGRMAFLVGSYNGYVGFWTNCKKYKCANLGQVTVLIHMSMGFATLALALSFILLASMGLSFQPVFRRLNKLDLAFSFLSCSIGLLTVLSMTLFVVNCQALKPKPLISYLLTTYLSGGGGLMMLWAGALNYLNHLGLWSQGSLASWDRRVSYRRWIRQQSVADPKLALGRAKSSRSQGTPSKPL